MKHTLALTLIIAPLFTGVSAAAIVDDFQDGTTMGWIVGDGPHPAPPVNISSGGPGGLGDAYLQLTALGGPGGPGSKLSAFNLNQWALDYIDAGISAITVDLRNFGPEDVYLRLLLADPFMGPPSNIAVTNDVAFLQAGSDWTRFRFSLAAPDLNVLLGTAEAALRGPTELRFFHNQAPVFPGPPGQLPSVNAIIGIDNVTAVPEPGTFAVVALGLAAAAGLRRRAA